MQTVVQFGAGNIGRGFMGDLFTAAGYEVVFVDVVPEVVAALNERRSYPLRLVGPDRFLTRTVQPVRAVSGRDTEAVARELAACAFACTAVGVGALPHLAAPLAAGIRQRKAPLDVILCENQLQASELVRAMLRPHLEEAELARVGLVESVVSRMVPVVPEEVRREDPLLAVGEDYAVLPVARAGFVGEPPAVPGLQAVDDFPAYFDRKLYVHNAGHAVAAYLGYRAGCDAIHDAMGVPAVADAVEGAMAESCEALARKHGTDRARLREHRRDLQRRFGNAALNDTILRVGRDPVRKLRAEDRLTGAALTCLDHGVEPRFLARGIAAALRFDPGDDPAAQELQQVVREDGPGEALVRFTGQRPDSELGRLVMDAWEQDSAAG